LQELAQNKPIDKITINEIAQNCQLTSTTFYNHFQDKYALLAWIFQRDLSPLYEHLGKDIDWNTLLTQGCNFLEQNKQFYRNALKNTSGQTSFLNTACGYSIRQTNAYICQQQGVSELSPKMQFIIRFYVLGIFPLISEWVLNRDEPISQDFISFLQEAVPEELRPYLL